MDITELLETIDDRVSGTRQVCLRNALAQSGEVADTAEMVRR
jgi:hypothetical protein